LYYFKGGKLATLPELSIYRGQLAKYVFLIQGEASEGATVVALENKMDAAADKEHGILEGTQIASESKKDPSQRRHELLIKSKLAEVMIVLFLYEK
jgi:hypothetical protein